MTRPFWPWAPLSDEQRADIAKLQAAARAKRLDPPSIFDSSMDERDFDERTH